MIIRDAKRTDFEGILKLSRSFYKEASKNPDFGDYVFKKLPSKKAMHNWFCKLYAETKKQESVYMIAEEGNTIIGHCFIRPFDIPRSERSHVGRLSIFVMKDYRGRRIGKRLIKTAIKKASRRFEIVDLDVISNNNIARQIYKKFGFKSWGIAPGFIKRGKKYLDTEYMYLKLQ